MADPFYGTLGDLTGGNAARARDAEDEAAQRAVDILRGELYEEAPAEIGRPAGSGAAAPDVAAQQLALAQLAGGGLTPEAQARQDRFAAQAFATEQGARGASLNRALERGGGGVAEELSGIQGAQNQAWVGSDLDAGFSAAEYGTRLAALDELGRAAGTMRRQGFGERFDTASAIDRFNEMNTQERQSRMGRNADRYNQRSRDIADARLNRAQRAEDRGAAAKESGSSAAGALGYAAASSTDDDGGDRDDYGEGYY